MKANRNIKPHNQPVSHRPKEIGKSSSYKTAVKDGLYELCHDLVTNHKNSTKEAHHEEPTKSPRTEAPDVQYQCHECNLCYRDFEKFSSCMRFHIFQERCRAHKAQLVSLLGGEEEAYARAKAVQHKLVVAARRVDRAEIKREQKFLDLIRYPCPRCGDRYSAAFAASFCRCEQEPRGSVARYRKLRMTAVNDALNTYRTPGMVFESTELINRGDGSSRDPMCL